MHAVQQTHHVGVPYVLGWPKIALSALPRGHARAQIVAARFTTRALAIIAATQASCRVGTAPNAPDTAPARRLKLPRRLGCERVARQRAERYTTLYSASQVTRGRVFVVGCELL